VWSALLYISIALGLVVTFAAPYVIDFLYGEKYADAAPILALYIWCCIFVFHVSMRSRSMIIESMEKYIGICAVRCTKFHFNTAVQCNGSCHELIDLMGRKRSYFPFVL
jgi:hypothetical protein